MKEYICAIIGLVGGFVAALFGGWDSALATLLIFMAVDYVTGIITAAMGKSKKSVSGKLTSEACWQGLAKKFCVLLLLLVAVRLDIMLGTTYVRDAVCIAFSCNELLSILENMGIMGIPYPPALKNAVEILQEKAGRMNRENDDTQDKEE